MKLTLRNRKAHLEPMASTPMGKEDAKYIRNRYKKKSKVKRMILTSRSHRDSNSGYRYILSCEGWMIRNRCDNQLHYGTAYYSGLLTFFLCNFTTAADLHPISFHIHSGNSTSPFNLV